MLYIFKVNSNTIDLTVQIFLLSCLDLLYALGHFLRENTLKIYSDTRWIRGHNLTGGLKRVFQPPITNPSNKKLLQYILATSIFSYFHCAKILFFVQLVLCSAIDYLILLKARHDELINESITLPIHELISM